jgi:hypothetical protein
MRIPIVEDEKQTAAYLQKGLTEQGSIVDVSIDGEEGALFFGLLFSSLAAIFVARRGPKSPMRQLKEKRLLDGLFNPSTCLIIQCTPLTKYFKRYGRGECPDRHLLTFNNIALKLVTSH